MLIHSREGTTKMTQQEKRKTKPDWTDEQFTSKALLCSILSIVEKASLVICNGQFSFSHWTSQVEPSPLLLDAFSKSSTLPWKNRQQTASSSFFVKLLSRYNSWFSHDLTKIQTKKLSLILSFNFHVILENLKTFIQTNFRFKGVLCFAIQDAWISGFSVTRHLADGWESSYVG